MVLGGSVSTNAISSIELFPPSDACTIPPLPQPRGGHSLSLLSGGRLVVCGGFDQMKLVNTFVLRPALNTCISWVAGNTSWTLLYNMRCLPIMPQKHISIPVRGELVTRLGRRHLFLTLLCCSVVVMVLMAVNTHSTWQILCQHCQVYQSTFINC